MVNLTVTKRRVVLIILDIFTIPVGACYILASLKYLRDAVGVEYPTFRNEFNKCQSYKETLSITNRGGSTNAEFETELSRSLATQYANMTDYELAELADEEPKPRFVEFIAKYTAIILKFALKTLNFFTDTPFCKVIHYEVIAGLGTLATGCFMALLGLTSLIMNIACIFETCAQLRKYPLFLIFGANFVGAACGIASFIYVQLARDQYILWRNSFISQEACVFICRFVPLHSAVYDNTIPNKINIIAWIPKAKANAARINGAVTIFLTALTLLGSVSTLSVLTMLYMIARRVK